MQRYPGEFVRFDNLDVSDINLITPGLDPQIPVITRAQWELVEPFVTAYSKGEVADGWVNQQAIEEGSLGGILAEGALEVGDIAIPAGDGAGCFHTEALAGEDFGEGTRSGASLPLGNPGRAALGSVSGGLVGFLMAMGVAHLGHEAAAVATYSIVQGTTAALVAGR